MNIANSMGAAKRFFRNQTVLCIAVFFAILTSFFAGFSNYLNDVNWNVIALLFCLMSVVMGFRRLGIMDKLASKLISLLNNMRNLSFGMVALAFFTSMLFTNDVALISLVPLTMMILSRSNRLEYAPRLITLEAIAANLGSMATPLGNPQNLYLFTHYQMPTSDFFATMLPLSTLSLVLLTGVAVLTPKQPLQQQEIATAPPEIRPTPLRLTVLLILLILALLAVFRVIPVLHTTIAIVTAFLFLDFKTILKIDYGLLGTFVAFFIFVSNLQRIDTINDLLSTFASSHTLASGFAFSQFISNVPAAILLSGFTQNARELLAGVNIGGLGTLVASLASLIAFQGFIKTCPDQKSHFLKTFTLYNVAFAAILLIFWHFWQ